MCINILPLLKAGDIALAVSIRTAACLLRIENELLTWN
jgi:hypothetical protein